jgi:hypothetical protein
MLPPSTVQATALVLCVGSPALLLCAHAAAPSFPTVPAGTFASAFVAAGALPRLLLGVMFGFNGARFATAHLVGGFLNPHPHPPRIPTVDGNTVRSFYYARTTVRSQGSSTTVSRSGIQLSWHFEYSAHGLVRRGRLTGAVSLTACYPHVNCGAGPYPRPDPTLMRATVTHRGAARATEGRFGAEMTQAFSVGGVPIAVPLLLPKIRS